MRQPSGSTSVAVSAVPTGPTSGSVSVGSNRPEANHETKYFFFLRHERMTNNGATGRAVVTSTERVEGHEAMDEEQISDEGISSGHGTFVAHTGDVRGHRSVVKQHMSTGKVTEDTLMRRIDTYGLVSPTKAKLFVW
jgi:hypothetical protein